MAQTRPETLGGEAGGEQNGALFRDPDVEELARQLSRQGRTSPCRQASLP